MPDINIYHITDLSNLPAIIRAGGLNCDVNLQNNGVQPAVIGYSHIKERRMREITVPCSNNRFVGEFVPFYFCPRSPMLYTINLGNTGRERGCQSDIVHLVSTVNTAFALGNDWAYSNGNAGAYFAEFYNDSGFTELDWNIINSNEWGGQYRRDKKSAEFLFNNFYPWHSILQIGCFSDIIKGKIEGLINGNPHIPQVVVKRNWYY